MEENQQQQDQKDTVQKDISSSCVECPICLENVDITSTNSCKRCKNKFCGACSIRTNNKCALCRISQPFSTNVTVKTNVSVAAQRHQPMQQPTQQLIVEAIERQRNEGHQMYLQYVNNYSRPPHIDVYDQATMYNAQNRHIMHRNLDNQFVTFESLNCAFNQPIINWNLLSTNPSLQQMKDAQQTIGYTRLR